MRTLVELVSGPLRSADRPVRVQTHARKRLRAFSLDTSGAVSCAVPGRTDQAGRRPAPDHLERYAEFSVRLGVVVGFGDHVTGGGGGLALTLSVAER